MAKSPGLNAMFCVDGIEAPAITTHPQDGTHAPATFVTLGPYGSEVCVWTHDPATLRTIAAGLTEAARQLDTAIAEPVFKGVDARD